MSNNRISDIIVGIIIGVSVMLIYNSIEYQPSFIYVLDTETQNRCPLDVNHNSQEFILKLKNNGKGPGIMGYNVYSNNSFIKNEGILEKWGNNAKKTYTVDPGEFQEYKFYINSTGNFSVTVTGLLNNGILVKSTSCKYESANSFESRLVDYKELN